MTSCVKLVNAELNASELSVRGLVRTPVEREEFAKRPRSNSLPAAGAPDHTFGAVLQQAKQHGAANQEEHYQQKLAIGTGG